MLGRLGRCLTMVRQEKRAVEIFGRIHQLNRVTSLPINREGVMLPYNRHTPTGINPATTFGAKIM